MSFDASFFVALAFVLVILGFLKLKLPKKAMDALDTRSAAIKAELDEARALRDEARALLADYEQRLKAAEKEAAVLIEQAHKDVRRITEEAGIAMQARLEQRTQRAGEKIARAEAQLIQEIRTATTRLAIGAATNLIAEANSSALNDKLIAQTLEAVEKNFH